jgi:hypothetical protein
VRFQLLPRSKQEAAVKFLVEHGFRAPRWALNPEILRRIEPVGVLDRIEASQTRVLTSLLSPARVLRLSEQEAVDGAAAYAPLEFLADVRRGVWSEIYAGASTPIDAYRRNLQRAYVETLGSRVNGPQAQSDDVRAFFRGELKTLDSDLEAALPRQSDRASLVHIQDVRAQIARALDPTIQAPSGARSSTDLAEDAGPFDVTSATDVCWPDYEVKPRGR